MHSNGRSSARGGPRGTGPAPGGSSEGPSRRGTPWSRRGPPRTPREPQGPPGDHLNGHISAQGGPRGTGPAPQWSSEGPLQFGTTAEFFKKYRKFCVLVDPLSFETFRAPAQPPFGPRARARYRWNRLAAPHAMVPSRTPADPQRRRQAPKTGPGELWGPPGGSARDGAGSDRVPGRHLTSGDPLEPSRTPADPQGRPRGPKTRPGELRAPPGTTRRRQGPPLELPARPPSTAARGPPPGTTRGSPALRWAPGTHC